MNSLNSQIEPKFDIFQDIFQKLRKITKKFVNRQKYTVQKIKTSTKSNTALVAGKNYRDIEKVVKKYNEFNRTVPKKQLTGAGIGGKCHKDVPKRTELQNRQNRKTEKVETSQFSEKRA